MSVDVVGFDEAEEFLKGLGKTSKQAFANSINTLIDRVENKSVDSITDELNLSRSFVEPKFEVEHSTSRKLVAKIRARKQGLSLADFEAEQQWSSSNGKRKRAGVKVRVKRRQKKLRRAFMLKAKNGKNIVAIRNQNKDMETLYGPSVSQAFDQFKEQDSELVTDDFESVFGEELEVLL